MSLIYPKELCHLILENAENCTNLMIDFTQPVYEDEAFSNNSLFNEKNLENNLKEENGKYSVEMICKRCGEFIMEYISDVFVEKDVLNGIHTLMYHPFFAWKIEQSLSDKFPYIDLDSRFNKLVCSKCSSKFLSLDELFEHAVVHANQ